MRWFKHYSDCFQSETMDEIIAELGYAGYGRFWRIHEIIAFKMDKSDLCEVAYSQAKWSQMVAMKPQDFRKFAAKLQEIWNRHAENGSEICISFDKDRIRIKCPKLLELRDEYSNRVGSVSGETTNKNREKVVPQTQIQSQSNTVTTPTPNGGQLKIPDLPVESKSNGRIDPDEIVARWNAFAETLKADFPNARIQNVRVVSPDIKKSISARFKEQGFDLDKIFAKVRESKFLRGEVPPSGGHNQPFTLTFKFIFKSPSNWSDVLNDFYNRGDSSGGLTPEEQAIISELESDIVYNKYPEQFQR